MFEQILSSLDGLTDLERADVLRVLMSKDNRLSKVKALLESQRRIRTTFWNSLFRQSKI